MSVLIEWRRGAHHQRADGEGPGTLFAFQPCPVFLGGVSDMTPSCGEWQSASLRGPEHDGTECGSTRRPTRTSTRDKRHRVAIGPYENAGKRRSGTCLRSRANYRTVRYSGTRQGLGSAADSCRERWRLRRGVHRRGRSALRSHRRGRRTRFHGRWLRRLQALLTHPWVAVRCESQRCR